MMNQQNNRWNKIFSKNSKRGNLLDIIIIPLIVFVIAITLIVSMTVINKVDDTGIFANNTEAQAAVNYASSSLLNMDNLVLFILMGLCAFTWIASYFVTTHPGFFFFGVLLLLVAVFFAAIISNTYETAASDVILNESIAHLPKINHVVSKLPIYVCVFGFVCAVTMYFGYTRQG